MRGLTVIVDRNELQSDKPTDEIVSLGVLEDRFRAFGWHVRSCDGHDFAALREAFAALGAHDDRPQALVARTIKGKGVSFMEHPAALREGGGTYRWHAGAPDDESFERAVAELTERIGEGLAALGLAPLALEPVDRVDDADTGPLEGEPESGAGESRALAVTDEYVVDAYGDELVRLGAEREDLVVLDADLASDCRVRGFELAYPDRFVECGIAEQDMVSTAAGLARHGLAPRRQLVRLVPRCSRERADLQPGERAHEGRLRTPLRGSHPGGTGQVPSVGARHLPARRTPRNDGRSAGER